jgi:hypothetical protein
LHDSTSPTDHAAILTTTDEPKPANQVTPTWQTSTFCTSFRVHAAPGPAPALAWSLVSRKQHMHFEFAYRPPTSYPAFLPASHTHLRVLAAESRGELFPSPNLDASCLSDASWMLAFGSSDRSGSRTNKQSSGAWLAPHVLDLSGVPQ